MEPPSGTEERSGHEADVHVLPGIPGMFDRLESGEGAYPGMTTDIVKLLSEAGLDVEYTEPRERKRFEAVVGRTSFEATGRAEASSASASRSIRSARSEATPCACAWTGPGHREQRGGCPSPDGACPSPRWVVPFPSRRRGGRDPAVPDECAGVLLTKEDGGYHRLSDFVEGPRCDADSYLRSSARQ